MKINPKTINGLIVTAASSSADLFVLKTVNSNMFHLLFGIDIFI